MTLCENCIYYNDPNSLHSCSCPKMFYGYGRQEGDKTPDAVRIENDEEWGMIPGPKFGCIHGAPKP